MASGTTGSALPAIGEERLGRGYYGAASTTTAVMRTASLGSVHGANDTWYDTRPSALAPRDDDENEYHDEDDSIDPDPAAPDADHQQHAVLAGLKAKIRASANEHEQFDDAGLLRPIHVRRRFHSSDVVLRAATPTGGSFDPPRGGPDSPTLALRQWLATSESEPSPAQLRRHRQHRRTQSTDLTAKFGKFGSSHVGGRKAYPVRRSFELGHQRHNAIAEEILHDDSGRDLHDNHAGGADDDDDGLDSESDEDDESDMGPRSRRAGSEDSNGSAVSGSSFSTNTVARSYESAPREDPPSVEKLLNLQKLYQEGFITVTEYKDRRLQLVDEITMSNSNKTINRTTDLIQRDLPVIHRDPPDFTVLRERDAIKHVFDSEKRKWTSSRIKVKIDPQPFARGGLRQVFHLQDLSVIPRLGPEGRPVSYVAKIAMDVNEDPDTYFRDVEMQAVASKFAQLYNSYNPPRRVEFLDAWILQLIPSANEGEEDNLTMRGTICGVEPYIAGEYHKHNNNYGYVSELERNTPQAFSHFTYEASGQQMLIVDIQGVSDHYTDPQIHTRSGKEFGKGNLSTRGFERFLESHRCNPICRYLKLPLTNPKDEDDEHVGVPNGTKNNARGTVPAQTYMSQPRVRIKRVDSELCHYYGDSKAFKKYQAKHSQHDTSDDTTSAFVAALKEQRNCSSFCGVGLCTIS